ncbi:putative type III restriction-modification system methyltransferase [uncultured Paludibacter sp.]|jgi:adenine specific DNA methylase Mod|nr:putative type III restriction-modification system methyltransferase [uncultured Paludibacter sp.]
MIKDILQHNEALTPNSQTLEVLQAHFPQCFNKEGFFDVDKFKELIKADVDITHEGYDLNFLGKNYAKLLASIDTTTVIQPDVEHNAKPENANSQNLYISGDNLDGLKHLLKSYTGAVKCIYIDPPYNTGSDGFVYNDNFNFTPKELIDKLSISEEQAQKIFDLTTKGRASHSAWLTFIYPRLLLARDLLTSDGVIFISIDDNEQANLKLICDSVFGEEAFVAQFIWKSRQNKDNRNISGVSVDHEYVLCYTKNNESRSLRGSDRKEEQYSNPDNDIRGDWASGNMAGILSENERPNCHYDLINPKTGINYGKPKMGWRYDQKTMARLISEDRIIWPETQEGRPRRKVFLSELSDVLAGYSSIIGNNVFTRTGTSEINELFPVKCFDFPKSIMLIKEIIDQTCSDNDIVLDFFSGSATTAHAVMQLNSEDGGKRKFISVQLPVTLDPNNASQKTAYEFLQSINLPTTLDFIGMERIRRAAEKIKTTLHSDIDYGFKHYTLVEPSEDTIDKLEEFKDTEMFTNNDTLSLFGKETVLETWLVKDGYGFGAKVENVKLADYTAYLCGKHLYFIEAGINENDMVALLDRYQQEPSFSPENIVVFGYSFNFSQTEMLRKNLFVLRDTHKNLKANFDIRY